MCPQSQARAPWETSHTGVVSLLEMLDFAAADFLVMSTTLTQLTAYQGKAINFIPGGQKQLVSTLNSLNEHASRLGMRFVMNQIRTIYDYLETGTVKASRLADMLEQLSKRVHEELSARTFFCLSDNKSRFFQWYWLAGTPLTRPSLESVCDEFRRAGRCFAFGENTACVFHLMRVVEWAVKEGAVLQVLSDALDCIG